MRILIYGINYAPELTGIGKYSGEMAEWLTAQGHEVIVITAPPYYPQWEVLNGYSSWRYHSEILSGVKVWRCPVWVPGNPSGIKRIIHLASFAISSFPVMLAHVFRPPDVVLVIEPPLFCAPTSLFTSWLSRSHSWLHIQDFEVDAAFDLGILSSKRLKRIVLMVERWLMSKFDRVSIISEQMIKRLDSKQVTSEKQVLFPNWVDLDHIYPVECSGVFRNETGIQEDSIVFLYSGNMGEKQGLEIVIEAARALLEHKNIVFVMCGQGAAYNTLFSMANGLTNIHWLPLQPLDKLNELLNMADVHLLPQRADAADLVMPSKLTGMLASGRPVLATALEGTQIAQALETTGVIVQPEDADLFVKAIVDLSENKERRQNLGESARQYAIDHLGKDAILSRFEASLRECVEHNNK
ncbi:Glycosyl transferase, group 1 [hydrothermal vent metagenome]|uniref:Glycosyl transferase, group 1 n=1 Tax=hydrothermal vent metagenome TaxID=652676 RepID=A0A3B0XPI7_9ZZZZ